MKIRMLHQISGTRNSVPWPSPGEEIELPDHEAMKLCRNGLAVPVPDAKEERAVAPEPEIRAPKKRGRPRKK